MKMLKNLTFAALAALCLNAPLRADEQVPFKGHFNPIILSATPIDATDVRFELDVNVRATHLGKARGPNKAWKTRPNSSTATAHEHDHRRESVNSAKFTITPAHAGGASHVAAKLPPLPADVTEIKFGDFFVRPVGTRGLEVTDQLRQLDGRRVRILGYMVQQEEAPPGRLLLAPVPAQIHEHDNGLADDLPPSLVFVSVPTLPDSPVPHVPGLMLLTGTLGVGGQAEKDGRISLVRLTLDPPERKTSNRKKLSVPTGKGAERLMFNVSLKQDARR